MGKKIDTAKKVVDGVVKVATIIETVATAVGSVKGGSNAGGQKSSGWKK